MKSFLTIALVLLVFSGFSQTVSGFIVNEENNPIIGAQVMESGFRNGTTSNIDGSFILALNDPDSKLVFSFVGYQTDSLVIGSNELTQVVLKKEESVVSIFYSVSDYRVVLAAIWGIICLWLVVRTFREVASA